eukprot:CAMPEP_0180800640 /NCGR_PEP_ID=MMETSP1038_2-20121128/59200_1 /TAXON_ID=632150 /ORGANISM="Azadinium spinosum, Strain 3D9" /LENGTH=84 /DNA_ID=CAMNT_0022840359 /DNA_START=483 /DNA_END=737 /DNA_ORIENTATION=+
MANVATGNLASALSHCRHLPRFCPVTNSRMSHALYNINQALTNEAKTRVTISALATGSPPLSGLNKSMKLFLLFAGNGLLAPCT